MNGNWSFKRLLSTFLAYAVAAAAGSVIYVASQIVLESLYPTAPIPGAHARPETTPQPSDAPQTSQRSRIMACASLQNDVSRLRCFDTMVRQQ